MKSFDVKKIIFKGYKDAVFEDTGTKDLSDFPPDTVVIKTLRTAISCGTEKARLLGERMGDTPQGVFPGILGYSGAGVVEETGSAVKKFKKGDLVTYIWGIHANYQFIPESQVVKVPEGLSVEEAAFAFISTFPMAAIRKVRLEAGEALLVMGLGILGQFAVRLARAAGAVPIIAADPVEERRKEAVSGGADYALDPLEKGFAEKVKQLTGGGVGAAIEVTGVGAGLNETLDCMKFMGRVALLGCTRNSDFTVDYYAKVHSPGISLIGAHTSARPQFESSPGLFTHADDLAAVMKLCRFGRLDYKSILKEVHSPAEAHEVFLRLTEDKNFPIGVQFDWTRV